MSGSWSWNWLNLFFRLIAAVPSASSGLTYGRAALLGYTSGEKACNSAYPKCPRNEVLNISNKSQKNCSKKISFHCQDDLLYYLNNHKGGFFRFFNSGGAFGEDTKYQYNPHPQNYGQTSSGQQSSTLQNLAFIQSIANTVNESGGINLSNLGANAGLLSSLANAVSGAQSGGQAATTAAAQSSYDQSGIAPQQGINIGDLVGNLLTGVVGNRFSQRRISKRSIDESKDVKDIDKKEKISTEGETLDEAQSTEDYNNDEIEGRILNHKNIASEFVSFPSMKPNFVVENHRQIKFLDYDKEINGKPLAFPLESNRMGKKISFHTEQEKFFPDNGGQQQQQQQLTSNDQQFIDAHKTKMIFPDRTGTGNLKFDNEEFDSNNRGDVAGFRKGKILSGIRQIGIPNENYDFRPTTVNYENNGYQVNSQQNSNFVQSAISVGNNYNNRPPLPANNGEDVSKNIYVTNAHGVVEYYIKDGQKIFV